MCRYKIATLVQRVVRERDGVRRYRSSAPGLPLATYELLEEVCDAIEFARRSSGSLQKSTIQDVINAQRRSTS